MGDKVQRLEREDFRQGREKGTEKWMIEGREEKVKNDRGESSFKICLAYKEQISSLAEPTQNLFHCWLSTRKRFNRWLSIRGNV